MTDKKFPLIESLGLKTTNPAYWPPEVNMNRHDLIFAEDLERVLERAPVVYVFKKDSKWVWMPTADGFTIRTHTARLLCVEPIKKESAEDLLREILDAVEEQGQSWPYPEKYIERAKKVLEKG
jgi:hypothetical protein